MNEIITGYIIPGVIALLAAFGVFKVVKSEMGKIKSLKDLTNFFLTDETVLQTLNNIISDMELDVKHYDKFEDFLLEYKKKAISAIKEYFKNKNIPDYVLNLITDANIEKVIDTVIEKTNILTELDEIFKNSVETEVDNNTNTEVLEDKEDKPTDEEKPEEKKEETTDINLNSFYEN
jgi:hypothetical protein